MNAFPMIIWRLLILPSMALLLLGCKTTPAGDGSAQFKTVILPRFPIGHPADYEFTVNHSQPVFPHWIYFQTRARTSSYPYTPFDRSVIRVEMISMEGKVLRSTLVKPRAPRVVDEDEYRVLLWGRKSAPALAQFKVRIEVLVPSGRRYDKARIYLGTR